MNKRGLTSIVIVIIVMVIAVSSVGVFYIAGQRQLETVQEAEETIEVIQISSKSSILIEEIIDDDIIIRNNGFTKVPVDSFIVLSNASKTRPGQNPTTLTIEQINTTGNLSPGGVVNVTVCAPLPLLGEGLITVDGAYETRDEVLAIVNIPICS